MFVSPIGYLFFILHVFSNMQGAKKGAEGVYSKNSVYSRVSEWQPFTGNASLGYIKRTYYV